MRRNARRRVAEAYAPHAALLDEDAPRLCRTSQLALEADGAALAGRRVQAAMLRLSAFARQPSRDMAIAAAWDLFGTRMRPASRQGALAGMRPAAQPALEQRAP
jgi:hypothetical protein